MVCRADPTLAAGLPHSYASAEYGGGVMGVGRLAALAAACAFFVTTAKAAPPPLAAFGQLPAIERAAISPDGGQIAFILTDGEKRSLVLAHTADLKPYFRGDAGMNKVRWVQCDPQA